MEFLKKDFQFLQSSRSFQGQDHFRVLKVSFGMCDKCFQDLIWYELKQLILIVTGKGYLKSYKIFDFDLKFSSG